VRRRRYEVARGGRAQGVCLKQVANSSGLIEHARRECKVHQVRFRVSLIARGERQETGFHVLRQASSVGAGQVLAANRLVKADILSVLFPPRPQPPARVGHNGGAPGVNAEIWFYPESGWQLIALANADPPVATRMAAVLESAMLAADPEAACTAALAARPPQMPVLRTRP